jgi:hypothetical protein
VDIARGFFVLADQGDRLWPQSRNFLFLKWEVCYTFVFYTRVPPKLNSKCCVQSQAESAHNRSELEVCQEIYDVFIHSMGHSRVSLLESNQAIHQHAQCTH